MARRRMAPARHRVRAGRLTPAALWHALVWRSVERNGAFSARKVDGLVESGLTEITESRKSTKGAAEAERYRAHFRSFCVVVAALLANSVHPTSVQPSSAFRYVAHLRSIQT